MADDADMAQERMEREEALMRRPPYDIKPIYGDCMDCGESTGSIVGGVCKPCREDAERRARG